MYLDVYTKRRPRNLKEGIVSLLTHVNAMGAGTILTVMYGGELLYFWIWHDHLAQSAQCAHIIVAYVY